MTRRCIRCNVNIADDAIKCPLCHGVLEVEEGDSHSIEQESVSLTYPDVSASLKLMQFIVRLIIFIAIVAQITVLIINYFTFKGVYWSLIVGLGIWYGVATLLYSFRERKSLQKIISVQMFLGIVLLILLDRMTGGLGWSFRYALPILFIGVDAAALILMIVGIDGWQNYIITEIVTFVLSAVLLILHFTKIVSTSALSIIAAGVTGLILLGTVMLGPKMVSNELKRRFKI
ncbi:MAG: hypothetical protein J5517_02630 [Eubacterium sp.]|nr:hypothetical protein [Eubacterium sp.]